MALEEKAGNKLSIKVLIASFQAKPATKPKPLAI